MAVVQLSKRPNFVQGGIGYHYSQTIATGATGNDIHIPALPPGKTVAIVLIAGANTGKFQVTRSSDANVLAGTAIWFDITLSSTTGTVADAIPDAITGIRGVSLAGEIKIQVAI